MLRPRVLVVDDDPDIRRLYATALGRRYDVTSADGGEQARRVLGAERFGLLVLDLHMPGVDGFQLLADLAVKGHLNHEVPVLVVSADTTDATRSRAIRHRGVFCLSKPVPIGVLLGVVESTLSRAAPR